MSKTVKMTTLGELRAWFRGFTEGIDHPTEDQWRRIVEVIGDRPMVVSASFTASQAPKIVLLPDGRMSRKDAAKYLGRSEKTLAMWATDGKGPPSVLVGGRRFYFKAVLDTYIAGAAA